MDNPPEFQLPANHLLIAPSKGESEHLKQQGFNSTHDPFFGNDEYDHSFDDLDGKTVIILQGVTSDATGDSEAIISGLLSYPPIRVTLPDRIHNLSKDRLRGAIQEAIQAQKKKLGLWSAIMGAEDFISMDIPPKKMILRPLVSEQSIDNISGWRGIGKTWFTASIADAITRGESFGPWTTETPVPVCYIDGELPSADVQERFRVVASSSKRRRIAPLHIYSDSYASSLGLPRAILLSQEWKETMKEFLMKEGIKILVLDNISSLAPGIDENLKKDWDPINQWFLDLRNAGISTIPIFHVGKKGDQRGTSAHEDNVDISVILSPPPGYSPDRGARFILKFKKSRVKNTDLDMICDYEFSFSEVGGRAKWTWKVVKEENRSKILRLIDTGKKQSEIAKVLKVDKGYVSRIKKEATERGHLTEDGKLTSEGRRFFSPEDPDEE